MTKLRFKIATPEKVVYESEVDRITCVTELGEVTILPGHIPLVANLKPGELRVGSVSETKNIFVAGGFLEVRAGNDVVILADAAEHAEEIDLSRAEEARERARKIMSEEIKDADAYAAAEGLLERSLSRINVGKKRKYKDVGKTPLS